MRPRILLLSFSFFVSSVWAHNQPVHRRMSTAAVTKTQNLEDFIRANYSVTASSTPILDLKFKKGSKTWSASAWITEGADEEDNGVRFFRHFYNPIPNPAIGLTDGTDGPIGDAGVDFWARNSFSWGSVHSFGNDKSWQDTRALLYEALTLSSKSQRDSKAGECFFNLGHLIHLIQDLSQPSHTRNDNHYSVRYIEKYGQANINNLDYISASALDWKAAGFVRLKDFWDRDLFDGTSATPLSNDSGATTLGLAEFSNGNFLSEDSLYGESVTTSDATHYYKYPSLITGTNFNLTKTNFLTAAHEVLMNNQVNAARIYLTKTGEGVNVQHHATLSYMGYRFFGVTDRLPVYGVSIYDDEVLKDCHSIIIPKAVSYSAGALNYFFRGKIAVRLRWNKDNSNYILDVTNSSSQPLNGGAFELFSETDTGTRAPVSWITNAWAGGGTLAAGATKTGFEFQAASGNIVSYSVVYRGTIGNNGDDPVDQGLAVAAKRFQILRFNTVWSPYSDIDLYLVDPSGSVIFYGASQQNSGELDIDDTHGTGPENITLKSLEDGDYQVWVNYYADHYTEDDTETEVTPTPISVTFKTYFNTSAELDSVGFTLNTEDFGNARPFGVTGPATQDSWYIRKLVKVKDGKIIQH
jgi:hypothetical protein